MPWDQIVKKLHWLPQCKLNCILLWSLTDSSFLWRMHVLGKKSTVISCRYSKNVTGWLWTKEISFNQENCRNPCGLHWTFLTTCSLEQRFRFVRFDVNAPGVISQTVSADRSYQNRASHLFKEQENRQQR